MAKLTEEEAKQLKALQDREAAPDEPEGSGVSRVLNVSVDLGDPEQVKRAIGLGLLTAGEAEDGDGDGDGDGDEDGGDDEGPRRRGFFGDED